MKISKDTSEQLVIESKPGLLGWFLLVWAFVMLFFLVKSYFEIPRNMKNVFGAGTGGLFIFFAYMVFYEKTIFDFNKTSKQLIWKRRHFLKKTKGIISFNNIKNVVLQNNSGGKSAYNVRVALITDTEQIPLTTAYLGNDNLCILIAKKVRHAIKHPRRDLVMDSVKEMVKNGHEIEKCLEKLRPEEREALFLSGVEEYTASEIAELTNQSRSTVLSLINRGRKKFISTYNYLFFNKRVNLPGK